MYFRDRLERAPGPVAQIAEFAPPMIGEHADEVREIEAGENC